MRCRWNLLVMSQILINFLKHIQYFCVTEFQTNDKKEVYPTGSGISFKLIEKQTIHWPQY